MLKIAKKMLKLRIIYHFSQNKDYLAVLFLFKGGCITFADF